jgi:hypothetical protein
MAKQKTEARGFHIPHIWEREGSKKARLLSMRNITESSNEIGTGNALWGW